MTNLLIKFSFVDGLEITADGNTATNVLQILVFGKHMLFLLWLFYPGKTKK
jgi:hypothetical protein